MVLPINRQIDNLSVKIKWEKRKTEKQAEIYKIVSLGDKVSGFNYLFWDRNEEKNKKKNMV